jgi:hypothetical protein
MKSDYQKQEVDICLSVLLELMTILGSFRENIVLIGGWTPWFLIPEKRNEHTGSLDIDIALDSKHIDSTAYKSILQLLNERDYVKGEQPFIFYRNIQIGDGRIVPVKIDLLAREYGGTSKSYRTQRIQDTRARKARGCDLVFDNYITTTLEGRLPNGARNEVPIKIPGVVSFLATKGMALWESYKEKHAYDIYFVIKNYVGGIAAIVEKFKPFINNTLVKEGLGKIFSKFSSVDSAGPLWVANFLEITDPEEKERIQRDAYERINALQKELGIPPYEVEEI